MKKSILFIFIILNLLACDSMEDNYMVYLKNVKQYSPRVTNLTAITSYKTVVLNWDNPTTEMAKKIRIDIDDSTLVFDELINSYKFENLAVKGYQISVYTIDKYENLSIPTDIYVFPE